MRAQVLVESEASGRLAELGLTIELIERVVRRADAEASMCTALDPPMMEGADPLGTDEPVLARRAHPGGLAVRQPA
jgi:hypothetical protein